MRSRAGLASFAWLVACGSAAPSAVATPPVREITISTDDRLPDPAHLAILRRFDVPRAQASDVPAEAASALAAYAEAVDARRAFAIGAHDLSDDARAAAVANIDAALERESAARRAFVDALTPFEATLGRAALLALGSARYEIAAEATLPAYDAFDACVAREGTDCTLPRVDDASALATWARVTGDDVLAAHALYQTGYSLYEAADEPGAAAALTRALALAPLPPSIEAEAALLLGDIVSMTDPAAADAAYTRCEAITSSELAPRCTERLAALRSR